MMAILADMVLAGQEIEAGRGGGKASLAWGPAHFYPRRPPTDGVTNRPGADPIGSAAPFSKVGKPSAQRSEKGCHALRKEEC